MGRLFAADHLSGLESGVLGKENRVCISGFLRERLLQIGELQKQNRPVEIRGAICFSTCTVFIGLPNTCISPNTTFGFHGPSSNGRALDPLMFNRASRVIAS